MFLLSLLFLLSSFAQPTVSFDLRSLKDVSSNRFEVPGASPQLFLVFQADCFACRRQVKQLGCLDLPIHLLGAFSAEQALRAEYSKMGTPLPAYFANTDTLASLGITQQLTPQLLLVKHNRNLLFQGLIPCKTIKDAL